MVMILKDGDMKRVKSICGGCSRTSFFNSNTKAYSHFPIKSKCDDFKLIVEKLLIENK